jgi:hypothetical protein
LEEIEILPCGQTNNKKNSKWAIPRSNLDTGRPRGAIRNHCVAFELKSLVTLGFDTTK